jgi:hypothetical protein
MANLESSVLNNIPDNEMPTIYCRYIYDIFLLVNNIRVLENIKSEFQHNSVLKFTFEIEQRRQLTFLDVNVARKNNNFRTSVYVKPTISGDLINYKSIAPDQYKTGVMKTMLNRAYKISSDWEALYSECQRLQRNPSLK